VRVYEVRNYSSDAAMKCPSRCALAILFASGLIAVSPYAGDAQVTDPPVPGDTLDITRDTVPFTLDTRRRSRLAVGSGKTYNRVEGLPVHIGPIFADSSDRIAFSLEVFGVLRSANTFRWDAQNVGHLVKADLRATGGRGPRLAAASYDVVDAVEDWQMPRGEAGIAAFLFHRDYRDHYGRHGAAASTSFRLGRLLELELGFARERWSSLGTRQVLTLFRNNHPWRPNPAADDGHARLFTARTVLDTRNDARAPTTGWFAKVEYEHGDAEIDQFGVTSPLARFEPLPTSRYGRALLDLRRYNRVSPETQLNFRVVAGGWLHGDELPLQRRLSVGGPATIPGLDFRDTQLRPNVATCSSADAPPGNPAQCERLLLLQVEYRDELPYRPGTILGGTPLRIRSAALTLRPVLVAFADVGRGWLLPPRSGASAMSPPATDDAALAGLIYSTGRIPPLRTFSTDVGLGVDLGLLGIYVAKSVSESSEPANVFLRVHSRF
jgi:hypothetical protein